MYFIFFAFLCSIFFIYKIFFHDGLQNRKILKKSPIYYTKNRVGKKNNFSSSSKIFNHKMQQVLGGEKIKMKRQARIF